MAPEVDASDVGKEKGANLASKCLPGSTSEVPDDPKEGEAHARLGLLFVHVPRGESTSVCVT